MQVRLADTVCGSYSYSKGGDDQVCSWCQFRCDGHLLVYRDEGEERLACTVCFAARHAASAATKRFRLAWIPEISQPMLAHLCRGIAFLMHYDLACPETLRMTIPANSNRIMASLMQRADAFDETLRMIGVDRFSDWNVFPEGFETIMGPGLRIIPIAFRTSEITAWRQPDQSLAYTGAMLAETNCFVDLLFPAGDRPGDEGVMEKAVDQPAPVSSLPSSDAQPMAAVVGETMTPSEFLDMLLKSDDTDGAPDPAPADKDDR